MFRLLYILFYILLMPSVLPAQTEYKMAGPYEVIARDGEYHNTKAGSERDMAQALAFAKQDDSEQACRIINAYVKTLKRVDGHDAPLCTIQGYDLVRAMNLMRKHKTAAWDSMVRTVWLPVLDRFEADSPYANGNWGAIVNRMRMACGIYLQDSVIYKAALDYFLYAYDNGSLLCYISETGQCQETGRDQAHVQLGLEALAQTCEMAWQQGDDLWGAYGNRLMKGFEYCAKYNLGYDMPFTTWQDCTGLYCDWQEPGAMSRGRFWDIYRLPYSHYNGRKGLRMPYVKKVLKVMNNKREMAKYERLSQQKHHEVFTYPAPEGAPLKYDYSVYVQPRGSKEWMKIDTYKAKVNSYDAFIADHCISEISYGVFDFTGDVFVRVVNHLGKFNKVRIRPDYKGVIANVQNDSTVQFLLFQPENVSVEFDGDISSNLMLFTSKPPVSADEARKKADLQGRRFVYYPAGMYSGDTIHVNSNTTIYLAGGSYFTNTFAIDDAENVSILGRGICRPESGYEGVHVYRSRNVLVDGVTLCTCPVGECRDVTLHDVHSISHPAWGDGLNVFGGSSNILFDRVFCRNSDDCTTVYATRKGFRGSVDNVRMRNSSLWADVAHAIMIGIHGIGAEGNNTGDDNADSWQRDSITNLVYENIDILGQTERQIDYQGCMAINCGDNNVVKGVVFDNIRIEDIEEGSLLHVKTVYNSKYCSTPGKSVEEVTFRNIRYGTVSHPASRPSMSIISGYNADHPVRNIHFENLKINGKRIYDDMPGKLRWYQTTDYANIYVNEHVTDVTMDK